MSGTSTAPCASEMGFLRDVLWTSFTLLACVHLLYLPVSIILRKITRNIKARAKCNKICWKLVPTLSTVCSLAMFCAAHQTMGRQTMSFVRLVLHLTPLSTTI